MHKAALICLIALIVLVGAVSAAENLCPFPSNTTPPALLPLSTESITASIAGQCTGVVFGSESYDSTVHQNLSTITGYGSYILAAGTVAQAKQTSVGALGLNTQNAIQFTDPQGMSAGESYGALSAGINDGNPYNIMVGGGSSDVLYQGAYLSQLALNPVDRGMELSYQAASGGPGLLSDGVFTAWSGMHKQVGRVTQTNETINNTTVLGEPTLTALEDTAYRIDTMYIGQHQAAFSFEFSADVPAGDLLGLKGFADMPCG